jgi:hypothetical protein
MIGAGMTDVCQSMVFPVFESYLLMGTMFFFYILIHGSFWFASEVNKKFGIWIDKKSEGKNE